MNPGRIDLDHPSQNYNGFGQHTRMHAFIVILTVSMITDRDNFQNTKRNTNITINGNAIDYNLKIISVSKYQM